MYNQFTLTYTHTYTCKHYLGHLLATLKNSVHCSTMLILPYTDKEEANGSYRVEKGVKEKRRQTSRRDKQFGR